MMGGPDVRGTRSRRRHRCGLAACLWPAATAGAMLLLGGTGLGMGVGSVAAHAESVRAPEGWSDGAWRAWYAARDVGHAARAMEREEHAPGCGVGHLDAPVRVVQHERYLGGSAEALEDADERGRRLGAYREGFGAARGLSDGEVAGRAVPEGWHEPDGEARRRLQSSVDCNAAYLSVAEADTCGLTSGLRATVLWDIVDQGLDPYQCTTAGTTVAGQSSFGGGDIACTDMHLMSDAKKEALAGFTEGALLTMRNMLRGKPVVGGVTPASGSFSSLGLRSVPTLSNVDTDMVVYVTARPDATNSIAGYAYCIQTDQYGRCTVGIINWVPNTFDIDNVNQPSVVQAVKRTSLHELMHLLDVVQCEAPIRADGTNGLITDTCVLRTDAPWNRNVVEIVGPKVVALAREHYNCSSISGMPIEDMPTGAGSHWEARLMGSELMSYGAGSGEGYVSDFTLAFVEDLGHYIANYSVAGRLTPLSAEELAVNEFEFLAVAPRSSSVVSDEEAATGLYRPGTPRWGRGQGCDFMYASPGEGWLEQMVPSVTEDGVRYRHYICDETDVSTVTGCTADNRMQAVCSILEYGDANPALESHTCEAGRDASGVYFRRCATNANYPGLPEGYAYLDTPTSAGSNSAMDYVPHRGGFWNCQDKLREFASDVMAEGGVSMSYGASFNGAAGDAADAVLLAGQVNSPQSRCHMSSLTNIQDYLNNPVFYRYGLCYPTNCYKSYYLQIGIQKEFPDPIGVLGLYWY